MNDLKLSSEDLRTQRLRVPTQRIPVTVAALWPKSGENLGTLLRTCDAVGARLVIPADANARKALRKGNTVGYHPNLFDTVADPMSWLVSNGTWRIALELVDEATTLADLDRATTPTTLVLGHESSGVPDEALAWCHQAVTIPMSGVGNSLNVAVAASLALYKLAGLA